MAVKKTVLVVGGAGCIGSHLCEALVADANVICVDHLVTGSAKNLQALLEHPSFEFINHDITTPLDVTSVRELARFRIEKEGIQEIYHLASPVSQQYAESFKVASILTHSIGTKNVMDVAAAYQARVLFASSGTPSEGQRFSEYIVRTMGDAQGVGTKIARVFRTIGPRMRVNDGQLLPDLVAAALTGDDLSMPGDEDARLAWCDVADMVQGLMALMASPVNAAFVDLGSATTTPLVNVAKTILDLTGSSSHVRFQPTHMGVEAMPDLTRARDILHWNPTTHLDHGLRQLVQAMKE